MFELERLFEGFYEGLFLKFDSRFNQRGSRLSSVDLPLPLVPTNAQEVPAGTVNDTPSRMGCPSRYPKATSRNSMSCPCGAGCSSVASALSCIETCSNKSCFTHPVNQSQCPETGCRVPPAPAAALLSPLRPAKTTVWLHGASLV